MYKSPWAIFLYKIKGRVRTLAPNFTVLSLKMWAYNPKKSLKLVIFGINFPKKGIPLTRFLQNLAWGGRSKFAPSCQMVSLSVKKCGSTAPKNCHSWNFLYKFAQKGYTPLSHFYNILPGGESPRTAPSCHISPL